ncbi:MAG: hypothetical protein WD844_13265 [Thermoleophilaceae bacterium]
MSFNVYDGALRPTDALADQEIVADAGSTNPFLEGARRDAEMRDYTVRIVPGTPPPGGREPNTVYLASAGRAAYEGGILYRVYIPDLGTDDTGGVGLPEVLLRDPEGAMRTIPARCGAVQADLPPTLTEAYASADAPETPVSHPATNPLDWDVFFNLPYTQATLNTRGTPANGPAAATVPADRSGGYLSNVHNAYAYAYATGHRRFGQVLVLRGRAPSAPATRDGPAVMGSGELRYWSICENERHSTRFVACLADEDFVLDETGWFTLVVSSPAQRPANARRECGVNWLPWGASPETLLILRHMLPAPGFSHAIQRVERPGDEDRVVGDYLPGGQHTSRTSFEALGCRI